MGDGTGVGDGDYWKLFDNKHLWELTDISENFIPQIQYNTLTNYQEYFFPQKSIIKEDLILNNDEILNRYIGILSHNL